MITNVRTAKAKLSELLERAARGEEVVIASDGRPKARLVAVRRAEPYVVNRALLRRGRASGPRAETLVRADRDARD